MTRQILALGAAVLVAPMGGCDRETPDATPAIALGEDVCNECGMIISDERFAAATIVEGPRGPEPRLFDDYNCQINYDITHPDDRIVTRWAHDYADATWVPTEHAWFVHSPALHTPMGSQTAAYKAHDAAEQAASELGGDLLDFDHYQRTMMLNGGDCSDHHTLNNSGETDDG